MVTALQSGKSRKGSRIKVRDQAVRDSLKSGKHTVLREEPRSRVPGSPPLHRPRMG